MAFKIQCNRCDKLSDVEWTSIDVGYWVAPSDWLSLKQNIHLCYACAGQVLSELEVNG